VQPLPSPDKKFITKKPSEIPKSIANGWLSDTEHVCCAARAFRTVNSHKNHQLIKIKAAQEGRVKIGKRGRQSNFPYQATVLIRRAGYAPHFRLQALTHQYNALLWTLIP